jgi:hypothetical protein
MEMISLRDSLLTFTDYTRVSQQIRGLYAPYLGGEEITCKDFASICRESSVTTGLMARRSDLLSPDQPDTSLEVPSRRTSNTR